jgi:hypothetical protein
LSKEEKEQVNKREKAEESLLHWLLAKNCFIDKPKKRR